eukprot:scaffold260_cov328-Prasinococcus_capsulatus_cf.AAC.20
MRRPGIELLQNKSPKVDQKTMAPASYPEDPEKVRGGRGGGAPVPSVHDSACGSTSLTHASFRAVLAGVVPSRTWGRVSVTAGEWHARQTHRAGLRVHVCVKLGQPRRDPRPGAAQVLRWFVLHVVGVRYSRVGLVIRSGSVRAPAAGKQLPFLMEVCERTAADKKGGHLALKGGQLLLREAAMCPSEDEAAFQDITKHTYFNTNNLWVSLKQLKAQCEKNGGLLPLPLIKNKKTVNPRDDTSTPVFQLETAMGSAIECFTGASAVVVPRSRFAPVKTCNDLLALRSDAYRVTQDARLVLASQRQPVISLDSKFYKKVDKMEALVEQVPSLVGCEQLKVKGPVKFVPGTVIHGAVEIVNGAEEPKDLPAGDYDNDNISL